MKHNRVTGNERMSETPDVSMDLLELEDGLIVHDSTNAGVNQPNIGSDFPAEEGEEESHFEEDDVVGTPFLGPNPMTEIELRYEDLFLLEIRHVITEPLQQVLGSTTTPTSGLW